MSHPVSYRPHILPMTHKNRPNISKKNKKQKTKKPRHQLEKECEDSTLHDVIEN